MTAMHAVDSNNLMMKIATASNLAVSLVYHASKLTGIKESRLYGTSRTPRTCAVRGAIGVILRRCGWSLQEVGEAFCRGHGTIQKAGIKSAKLLTTNEWFSNLVSKLDCSIQEPTPIKQWP